MKGFVVALLEITLFFLTSALARWYLDPLQSLGWIMYYWFCFTILTGYWESVYITNFHSIAAYADQLVKNHESVWFLDYPISYVKPNLLARIFYAEYGANADREYKSHVKGDYWSRLIESSHALCCAAFCLASLVAVWFDQEKVYRIGLVGMGMQFMNSLLYMGEYFLQCKDKNSMNYDCSSFPLGKWMYHRIFMWINIFWLLFPTIIIFQYC